MTPWIFRRTVVAGYTQVTSGTRDFYGSLTSAVYTSTPPCAPPSVLWNNIIGNIRQTTTPNLRYTNVLNSPIYRSLTNYLLCRPSVFRYYVINYPEVPAGISTRTVE